MNPHNPHLTDYQVIEADSAEDLAKAVMHAIRNRWQPFGNLAVVTVDDGMGDRVKLFQPMVQHAEWFA